VIPLFVEIGSPGVKNRRVRERRLWICKVFTQVGATSGSHFMHCWCDKLFDFAKRVRQNSITLPWHEASNLSGGTAHRGTACCPNLTRCHAIPPMVVGSTLLSKNRFDGRLTICRARFSQVRRWLFNFSGSVRSCLYLFGAAVTIPRFGDAPTCSVCGLDKCNSQVHVFAVPFGSTSGCS
jgi:hypothetical protein